MKSKKWQPSNGTEGEIFIEEHCMICRHCNPDPEGKKQCEILCKTMVYDISDEKYPKEWQLNEEEEPICTNWVKWDWEELGDPDDENNPNYIIPVAPNQISLFKEEK